MPANKNQNQTKPSKQAKQTLSNNMEPSAAAPKGDKPIQLYSLATPNGQKIGIALEEMGLEYDAHTCNIMEGVQFKDWFKELNPNSKIPVILDTSGPSATDTEPIAVFESGAILLYLAEKTGKFLPTDARKKYQTIEWLMWQMAGFGPMLGQMGHFHKYAKEDVPYGKERYLNEGKRLFGVLDKQLKGKEYVIGDEYTIADMAIYPWVICVDRYYGLKEAVGSFPDVERWCETMAQRPAVQRGMQVCPFKKQ
ncbi:Glutathione S-transferase [Balamuthia mandrillaris]